MTNYAFPFFVFSDIDIHLTKDKSTAFFRGIQVFSLFSNKKFAEQKKMTTFALQYFALFGIKSGQIPTTCNRKIIHLIYLYIEDEHNSRTVDRSTATLLWF